MKRQFNSEQHKNGTVLHNKIRSTKTEIVQWDHGLQWQCRYTSP